MVNCICILATLLFFIACVPQTKSGELDFDSKSQTNEIDFRECKPAFPSVSVVPATFSALSGDTTPVSLSVKNNNDHCSSKMFIITTTLPSLWDSSLPSYVEVLEGETKVIHGLIQTHNSTMVGNHSLSIVVFDQAYPQSKQELNPIFQVSVVPKCIKAAPSLSLTPVSQSAGAGADFNYRLTIINHYQNCTDQTFSIIKTIPNGWTSSLEDSITLESGERRDIDFIIKSAVNASELTYPIKIIASESQYIQEVSASITINNPVLCIRNAPSVSLSPSSFSGEPGSSFNSILTIKNNNQNCPSSVFSLSSSNLLGWSINQPSLSNALVDGESQSIPIKIDSVDVPGSFNINFIAQASGLSSQATGNFSLSITPLNLIATTVQNITEISAQIQWRLDRPANGQVEYGKTTNYGMQTNLESDNLNEHIQSINNLSPSTTYNYRIKSTASNGASLISKNYTFNTPSPVCVRNNPVLSISTSSFSAIAGQSIPVSIQIKDNNQDCGLTTYSLALNGLMSGFSSTMPVSIILNSGEIKNITFNVSTADTISAGSYGINFIASYGVSLSNLSLNFLISETSNNESECYPAQVNSLVYATSPKPSYPDYLQSVPDLNFGNQITRITDRISFGQSPSNSTNWLRHDYSKRAAWNSDGSLIKTSGWPSKLLHGSTYQVIAEGYYSTWSNVNPHKFYNSYQNELTSRTLNTTDWSVSSSLVHRFEGYSEAILASSEANFSIDDRYFVLEGKKSGSGNTWIILYDQQIDSVIAEKNIGNINIDWASMSQNGEYVVISGYADGGSQYQGISIFDHNLNYLRHATTSRPHADLCVDSDGDQVLVTISQVRSIKLKNGQSKINASQLNYGGHVSCRNISRPGWAYISTYAWGSASNPGQKEIIAVKLDGSGKYERFTKHYSDHDLGGYNHQAHGVASPDGTRVMFASNWSLSNYINHSYPEAFVVEKSCSAN